MEPNALGVSHREWNPFQNNKFWFALPLHVSALCGFGPATCSLVSQSKLEVRLLGPGASPGPQAGWHTGEAEAQRDRGLLCNRALCYATAFLRSKFGQWDAAEHQPLRLDGIIEKVGPFTS